MSNHKTPLTDLERRGLIAHGLAQRIGKPSQLADVFRAGIAWALAEQPAPAQQEPTDSMGMPISCGKPLCSPGDHHPLCKLAEQPAPAAPVQQEPNAAALFREALAFGLAYGPEIPPHQWDEMREEKVTQLLSRLATPQAPKEKNT